MELDAPVLSDESRAANFTNEGGVDGTVRYLKNVSGLWLLSESVRTWERNGERIDLSALLSGAAAINTPVATFDANHPSLLAPGDMPARIAALCADHDQPAPRTPAEYARSILESLAAAYADALDQAQKLSGRTIEVVHVVGGGSQNTLLCQLTADRTGRPVLAGPVEATAIGNVLVQARAAGLVLGDLRICGPSSPRRFLPVDTHRVTLDEDRAVHHLPGRCDVSRCGSSHGHGAGAARPPGGVSSRSNVLRADACEHRLSEAGAAAGGAIR